MSSSGAMGTRGPGSGGNRRLPERGWGWGGVRGRAEGRVGGRQKELGLQGTLERLWGNLSGH